MIVEELLATLGLKVDTEAFVEAEGLVGKLKMALGAIAVGLGLNELKEMVHGVAELGDAANKSSQKLGLSVESLQELGYAAKLSEVSQSSLEGALFRLSKGLEKVSTTGKGPAADALKKLHLNAKELRSAGLEDAIEQIADKFAGLPDGSQKAALAMQLFGGAGKKLIPFLNEGSAGIHRLKEEAHELGIVMSDETAEKFEEFNDDQTRVSEAWKGFKIQIVTEMLPALHGMVTGMLDWLKANGDWIRLGLAAIVHTVATAFQVLGSVIDEATSFVRSMYHFLSENKEITEVLVGLILAAVMPALLELIVTVGVLAAEFFVLNAPLILLISIITSLVILVNHWGDIWPVVAAKAGKAVDWIVGKYNALVSWFSQHVVEPIAGVFDHLGERIVKALSDAYDYVLYKTGEFAEKIWTKIQSIPGLQFLIEHTGLGAAPGRSGGADTARQVSDIRDEVEGGLRTGFGLGAPAPSDGVQVPESTHFSATIGDTSIIINPSSGLNEQQIGEIAAKKATEAQRNMLSDAYDRLRPRGAR